MKKKFLLRKPRNPSYVVLIKDEQLFSHFCPLALITEIHPGKDENVRAVAIRTQKGVSLHMLILVVVGNHSMNIITLN